MTQGRILQSLIKYIETMTKICFSYHLDSFEIDFPLPQVNVEVQMCPDSTMMLGRVFFFIGLNSFVRD